MVRSLGDVLTNITSSLNWSIFSATTNIESVTPGYPESLYNYIAVPMAHVQSFRVSSKGGGAQGKLPPKQLELPPQTT